MSSLQPTDPALPSSLPRPYSELAELERAWRPPKGWRLLSAVNNTQIGLFYIATALVFLVLAGVLGLIIRAQLAVPDNNLVSAQTYNQIFTMHGTVMMFLFAVPVVEAIAVYLLPGMLGARDLPFPRLSAYAFWAYAIGGLAFFCTIFFGVSPDGGWYMYPPLTSKEYSPGIGADFWLLGIGFIEISAIAGAIELIIGILMTRAPGMTLGKMPIFAWAMLVTAFMIVFAFPAIIAGTLLLELERAFDWPFFIAARGGDPLLWQHLFWFFGHPEVYIIFLPAAGMVSMMVPTMARMPLSGHRAIVWALVAVGVVSFALWMHHMFTAGLGRYALAFTSAASLAIAIPSGVQVFSWISTLFRGNVRMSTPTLFLLGFHFIFVLGGLTGVMVAVLPFNWQVHDTYFIVAHLHYVLIGGMVFPVFAALYYWAPIFNGHTLSERAGKWAFGLMFFGFNLAFFPMHISGLLGMPRRVATYAGDLGWNTLNMLSSIGAFILAAGFLVFFIDGARWVFKKKTEHGNPWQAGTLEWLPQGEYGPRSIPQVDSVEPQWNRPTLAAEVVAGRYFLPGTHSGNRETLVTSWRGAVPRYLLVLPGDSWWPFIAAAGTAGFFLLLTVELIVLALACGVTAIVAMLVWLWNSDHPPHANFAEIADGVHLPVGAQGRNSHSFWAMVILLLVDASVFASLVFAHVHVAMAAEVCPPPGSALPDWRWPVAGASMLLAGSALLLAAKGRAGRVSAQPGGWVKRLRPSALVLFMLLALLCLGAAFGLDLHGHQQAGLNPALNAWSASVSALLGWQGFHVAVLLVMGLFVCARQAAGKLLPNARESIDNTAVLWHYVTLQGLVGMAVIYLMPLV